MPEVYSRPLFHWFQGRLENTNTLNIKLLVPFIGHRFIHQLAYGFGLIPHWHISCLQHFPRSLLLIGNFVPTSSTYSVNNILYLVYFTLSEFREFFHLLVIQHDTSVKSNSCRKMRAQNYTKLSSTH